VNAGAAFGLDQDGVDLAIACRGTDLLHRTVPFVLEENKHHTN
jgi:hypothetical protein